MQPDSSDPFPGDPLTEEPGDLDSARDAQDRPGGLESAWESLVRLGLGETALRVGTSVASIFLFLIVVWVMGNFYVRSAQPDLSGSPANAAALPTATPTIPPPQMADIQASSLYTYGISRQANLHTILPTRARLEVVAYTVQAGDTLFGIAERFNLKPETVLWGNYNVLADDPERLQPGQQLNILPVDGVYYEWHAGDGLNGVAKFYGVNAEAIINWPSNHLDANTLGDLASPNIKAGTWLVIPGGHREFVTWSAPRITRQDPSVAKVLGPGVCSAVVDGAVGTGTFIWPTTAHSLSGYDYSPETNHYGIDIAGSEGSPVYAVDNGVVVYAGPSDIGYGNVIVVDHGNGWQSLYAHLSAISVACGASVNQGDTLGAVGSTGNATGPHLHFELSSDKYGRVNPWNFLKP